MFRKLFYVFLLIFPACINGQENSLISGNIQRKNFFTDRLIECKYHYGFIWPHHSSIEYSVTSHVPAFEINLLYQTTGKDIWEKLFRKPRIGYGFSYYYMRDHDVFGSALGFYGLYDIPFLKIRSFVSTYRINCGLSYLTEVWDLNDNFLQTAIGSHINIYFRLSMNARLSVSKKSEFIIDAGITHCSNGRTTLPNLGINLVTSTIGYIYKFNASNLSEIKYKHPGALKRFNFNLSYAGGIVAVNHFINERYYKSTMSIQGGYNLNYRRQIGVGFDLFFDGPKKYDFREAGVSNYKTKDLLEAGMLIYQDLIFRKLVLTIQAGYYLYHRYDYDMIYNRYGLKYKLNDHTFVSLSLKAHTTRADFVEWGVGYSF